MDARTKALNIYSFIKDNIYFCNNDIIVGGTGFNSALTLGILTSLNKGSILYVGEYGLGKTTLSETISSLIYSTPIDIIQASSIKGNPELSYEQMIGRPDLGELNKGNEQVIWSRFIYLEPKIVDEINRIPEHKQNILLTGMETNNWQYLNSFVKTTPGPWFATKNYRDSGNNGIIPPLLDRFSVSVESKSPGVNNSRMIRFREKIGLSNQDLTKAYSTILEKKNISYDEYKIGEDFLRHEFRKLIKSDYGIELLDEEELKIVKQEIDSVGISKDANYALDCLVSELGSCQLFGQKRSYEECPTDCHYSNYACFQTTNNLSVRTQNAIVKYAKSVAWLEGKKVIDTRHLELIVPYALWHKNNIKEQFKEKLVSSSRKEPLELESFKNLSADIFKRARQVKQVQELFTSYVLNGKIAEAEKTANGQDHPVFLAYKNE